MRRYPQVGFSVARRRTRARRPAGMAGRPGRVGVVVQRRAISWRCQRRMVAGVTSSPRRRRTGRSRVRAAIRARSVHSSAGAACVVGVRRVRGAGPGSRCPWWRRIGCAAPSSPGAWRTSGRSAAAPPADHAGPPAADERQVTGCVHSFGHPQARRTIRARTPAGIAGDPAACTGWSSGGGRVAGASAGSWRV